MSTSGRLAALLAAPLLLLSGCGSGSADGLPASPNPALVGELTVVAASSLTDAFNDGARALKTVNPGLRVTLGYAGSQMLVQQIQQGAPADVVATADQSSMDTLQAAGLIADGPTVFARNRLEIAVAPGNPRGVHGLADLARADLITVLADPAVPAGRYGAQALQQQRVTVHPRSLELSVRAALAKVEAGEADVALVYATDVAAAGSSVSGVAIPDAQNVIASYPIAVVKGTRHRAAALAFVDAVVAGAVQTALQARGFLAAA